MFETYLLTFKILADLLFFGSVLGGFYYLSNDKEHIPLAFLFSGLFSLFYTQSTRVAMYENLLNIQNPQSFLINQACIFGSTYVMLYINKQSKHFYSNFNALLLILLFTLLNLSYMKYQLTFIHFIFVYFITSIIASKVAAKATWERHNS